MGHNIILPPMPETIVLDALEKNDYWIGIFGNQKGLKSHLNPFGYQTPFWVYNESFDENDFVFDEAFEWSFDGIHFKPAPADLTITINGKRRCYIHKVAGGASVMLVDASHKYSIGGNLFSLTRDEWSDTTVTQEDVSGTARGEFEAYFMNHKNLIHAKDLILSLFTDKRAYNQLFKGCVNLEDAPAILAEECQSATYSSFLSGCAKVTEIRCNITTWQQYTDFSLGLPAMGKFYKRESAAIPQGKDGTPDGWEIIDVDTNHLGNQTPFWVKNLSLDDTNSLTFEGTLQYSWDAVKWDDLTGQSGTLFPQQKVFLRTKPSSGSKVKITASTMPFEIGGNLFSLTRDEWNDEARCVSSEFAKWFYFLQNLIYSNNIILPQKGYGASFTQLFSACQNMIKTIKEMRFDFGYGYMCSYMFSGCSKLKESPSIYCPVIVPNMIFNIYSGCSNMQSIGIITEKYNPQKEVTSGVAEKGTFYKRKGVEIPIGTGGIPRGWNVVDIDEPTPFVPNPYGNATPFWIRSLEEGDNQIQLSGECQISRGKGWSDCKFGRITLQKDERIFIRTMPEGVSSVKVLSSFRPFEVGGNIFSLTRDEWDEETIADANEFEGILKDTKVKLANNLLFPLNQQNSFVDMFANSELEEVTINNVLTYNASQDMLANCTKLKSVKYLATPYNEQLNWMHDASATGTFTKYRGVEIPTGANGIPNGWTTTEIDPPTPADAQPINE